LPRCTGQEVRSDATGAIVTRGVAAGTRWGDSGRAARLGEEIDFLTEDLASALGVGGRSRKAGDVADRARKAVTSRIRDTIARIAKEHPTLGRHLENAIRTGLFCCYNPDRSPNWTL